MINKNEEYIVEIIDNGFNGEGIAKIDNFAVFIDNAIKGEKVKIHILKVLKTHAYAKIIEIIEPSSKRVETNCNTYSQCGGCQLRHIDYGKTLDVKTSIVENCIYKALGKNAKVENTIGMGIPTHYRNKLQYPVGINENNKPIMGVYSERTHKIIETKKCLIQNEDCNNIAQDIFNWIKDNHIPVYDEKNLNGIVRHIVIRIGKNTNEIMVTLVLREDKLKLEKELVQLLTNKYKNIRTIVKNFNPDNTNVILGKKTKVIYGDGYIYDILGNYKFKISPLSFYQVNPTQTEILYNTGIEFAELTGKETIFDLYCGIGTIGIFASDKVKKVYGIEVIPEAIKDAQENAKINNIENTEFFVGEVENVLPKLIEERQLVADVIFIDPPRKGCDPTTLDTILKIEPKKIIYISCNPATLARDLKDLTKKYEIKKVQPVDMFPYTSHVECVVLLGLRGNDKTQ